MVFQQLLASVHFSEEWGEYESGIPALWSPLCGSRLRQPTRTQYMLSTAWEVQKPYGLYNLPMDDHICVNEGISLT